MQPHPKIFAIVNGSIVEPDKNRSCGAAVLIKDGVIERVVRGGIKDKGPVDIIDASGLFIIPGFCDGHTHLLARGVELQRVRLETCGSSAECLARLRDAVKSGRPEVFGVDWDDSKWKNGSVGDISKHVLDRISRDMPVIMRRICGHFAIVNSKALNMIPSRWQTMDRRRGYLYENASLYLNEIFKPSDDMYRLGLGLATEEALARGVTSIHEIVKPAGFRKLQSLRTKIRIRTAVYLQEQLDEAVRIGLATGLGDDYLKFAGIKYYLDGSIGARTAALNKPYRGSHGRGMPLVTKARLLKMIRDAEENDLQLMLHSIGDRTADLVVNAFKAFGLKKNRLRHRIEHLECAGENTIDAMARFGLILSLQPNFVPQWQEPGGMYEKLVGETYMRMNRFARLARSGMKIIFGSDSMPLDPIYGIKGAVNHPFIDGRLRPHQALEYYTSNGPYGTFEESKKGRITAGFLADLVLLDKDPLQEQNIGNMRVRAVFIGGKKVYQALV